MKELSGALIVNAMTSIALVAPTEWFAPDMASVSAMEYANVHLAC